MMIAELMMQNVRKYKRERDRERNKSFSGDSSVILRCAGEEGDGDGCEVFACGPAPISPSWSHWRLWNFITIIMKIMITISQIMAMLAVFRSRELASSKFRLGERCLEIEMQLFRDYRLFMEKTSESATLSFCFGSE